MILLLVACGVASDADRAAYTEGLRAADYAGAWSACARAADIDVRGDCQSAAAERFLEFKDCDTIEMDRWRDECHFVQSETLGRRGDLVGALEACKGSAYRAQCDDHVLGLLAVTAVDDDVAAMATKFGELRPHLVGNRGEGQFWAHYFRNRIARALVVSVDDCPVGPCRQVAEREIGAAIREIQRQQGAEAFCAAPAPRPAWATSDTVHAFIAAQMVRGCTAAAGGVPAGLPGGPPGLGGAPPIDRPGGGPAPAGAPGG